MKTWVKIIILFIIAVILGNLFLPHTASIQKDVEGILVLDEETDEIPITVHINGKFKTRFFKPISFTGKLYMDNYTFTESNGEVFSEAKEYEVYIYFDEYGWGVLDYSKVINGSVEGHTVGRIYVEDMNHFKLQLMTGVAEIYNYVIVSESNLVK
jgi:hypothetical protein